MTALRGRDFVHLEEWSADELLAVLDLADRLKAEQRRGVAHRLLEGRTIGLLFDQPSTRTRVSFGAGIAQLGATPLSLEAAGLQLTRGESARDTARILSSYLDALVVRTLREELVDELAEHADIPLVNALTERSHPCQALADAMTIRERFGRLAGVGVAYFGDGNNVCHSLMEICARLGARFVAATPEGYEPDDEVLARARETAEHSGGSVYVTRDPRGAAAEADVLYTDVWTSMGQDESGADGRRRDLAPYRVDAALVATARPGAIVLHCLPAHYGEEITEDVVDGPSSAVWTQAENRLHAQKALLALIVG